MRRGPDRLTKWAVGAFLMLLLAFVTGISGWAFTVINGKADKGVDAEQRVGIVENEQEHIKEDMGDLKDGQKVIVKGMQEIVKTLYTLPADRRANPMPVLEEPPDREEP